MLKKLLELLELNDTSPYADLSRQPILFGGDVISYDTLTKQQENQYNQIFAIIPEGTRRTPYYGPPMAANENLSFEDVLMTDIFPNDIIH